MQAKGELRAAHAEIDELKEDKAVLGKELDVKAKEIRMQLLQVLLLASETRPFASPPQYVCTVRSGVCFLVAEPFVSYLFKVSFPYFLRLVTITFTPTSTGRHDPTLGIDSPRARARAYLR